MAQIDIRKMQRQLGVGADGIAGIGTWSAFFMKWGAKADRAYDLAHCAARYFPEYGLLENADRLIEFMGQLIHESGSFRYMEEIASGAAYEGRKDLGNVRKGDGKRYKGRGPIQITGRANYRKFGRRIGIDIESNPEIAAIPSIGLHLGLEYWRMHGLNSLADARDTRGITRRINGGYNGLADRQAHVAKMRAWLNG